MLKLTQLAGFAAGNADVTPDPIAFTDISAIGFTAAASTNVVAITGIDVQIALRLSLSSGMSLDRVVDVFRDGAPVAQGVAGTTLDVAVANGQTLQFTFTNTTDNTTWSGTATVINLTANGATLDTFAYTLQDTGSESEP